jgi:hypothetical protein
MWQVSQEEALFHGRTQEFPRKTKASERIRSGVFKKEPSLFYVTATPPDMGSPAVTG